MKYFDGVYKRRVQKMLGSELLTKAYLKLSKKEKSMFVMTFLRNDTLEYACRILKISKKEAVKLKEKAYNHFIENVAALQIRNVFGALDSDDDE